MDRCEEDWYASDNSLRGTSRGSREKPNAGRWPTLSTILDDLCSRRPCCAMALRRTAWSEHGVGAAWQVWIRHGRTV